MIVDIHAHTFPNMGLPSGRDSVESHMKHIQHHLLFHTQGFRCRKDGKLVEKQMLFDGVNDGITGMYDVALRCGRYGQMEWMHEGEEYYIQWFPPAMQSFEAPPEFMIAQMDYAGIDKAVLQNDHVYGDLNQYLSECVRKYPNRFLALAQIQEWNAHKESELKRLRYAIEELGLKGFYYFTEGFYMTDFQENFDDEKYTPLWKEVCSLEIPVFWSLYRSRIKSLEDFVDQCKRLNGFVKKYPDIPSVITHGIETFSIQMGKEGRFKIYPELLDCLRNRNVSLEVSFHVQVPDLEYPYQEVRRPLQELYEKLGPDKLMWGSDMPAIERNCTYHQSLDWLREYCNFISSKDMEMILGGNAARLFGM